MSGKEARCTRLCAPPAQDGMGCGPLSTTQASWRVVGVLVVLAVFLVAGGSALALNKTGHAQSGPSAKLTLLRTHQDAINGRTMYSYQLEVPNPGILKRDESTLKLSDSDEIGRAHV